MQHTKTVRGDRSRVTGLSVALHLRRAGHAAAGARPRRRRRGRLAACSRAACASSGARASTCRLARESLDVYRELAGRPCAVAPLRRLRLRLRRPQRRAARGAATHGRGPARGRRPIAAATPRASSASSSPDSSSRALAGAAYCGRTATSTAPRPWSRRSPSAARARGARIEHRPGARHPPDGGGFRLELDEGRSRPSASSLAAGADSADAGRGPRRRPADRGRGARHLFFSGPLERASCCGRWSCRRSASSRQSSWPTDVCSRAISPPPGDPRVERPLARRVSRASSRSSCRSLRRRPCRRSSAATTT